jgi:hypothetical protein
VTRSMNGIARRVELTSDNLPELDKIDVHCL